MLDAELEKLWADYLQAERERVRTVMLPALERFIDRLLQCPPAVRHEWAKGVAAFVSDHGGDTPIRFPLFRRVLLPVLVEGVRCGEPGYARWLASFEPLLVNSREPQLPPNLQTAMGLLAEAVRVDPDDVLARGRLIEKQASYLEYSLHELPAGVLYGMNGATPEQCEQLLELLQEFEQHLSIMQQTDRFAELVSECRLHYRLYADYLRDGRASGGYEAYLNRRAAG